MLVDCVRPWSKSLVRSTTCAHRPGKAELGRDELNQVEMNQAEPGRAEPSQAEPGRAVRLMSGGKEDNCGLRNYFFTG